MEFSNFLPKAVRDWIAVALDGDGAHSWADGGWRQSLQRSLQEVHRLEGLMESIRDPEGLNNVRLELATERECAAALAENVAALERLACRAEMEGVFARLANDLPTDREVTKFVRAAWASHFDYGPYRERIKKAAEISRVVADAAQALVKALRRAETVGVYLPVELFSLRAALKGTDHPADHRNHAMWRGLRRAVLGEREEPYADTATALRPVDIKVKFVGLEDAAPLSADEEMLNTMHYAWGVAPRVQDLVECIQHAAASASPSESGVIGAALSSQKRNRKVEYLRGFGAMLRDQHSIALSANVMHAMATTANVMLNDPDGIVSYDDVRKAVL